MRHIFLFLTIIFVSGEVVATEENHIAVVSAHFGFGQAIEFCKWKHHGSGKIVEKEFLLWSEKHKELIQRSYEGLEEEAKNDPKKAKKLKNVGSFLTEPWFKFFTELPDWQSYVMCFERAALLETFNLEKINDI